VTDTLGGDVGQHAVVEQRERPLPGSRRRLHGQRHERGDRAEGSGRPDEAHEGSPPGPVAVGMEQAEGAARRDEDAGVGQPPPHTPHDLPSPVVVARDSAERARIHLDVPDAEHRPAADRVPVGRHHPAADDVRPLGQIAGYVHRDDGTGDPGHALLHPAAPGVEHPYHRSPPTPAR